MGHLPGGLLARVSVMKAQLAYLVFSVWGCRRLPIHVEAVLLIN